MARKTFKNMSRDSRRHLCGWALAALTALALTSQPVRDLSALPDSIRLTRGYSTALTLPSLLEADIDGQAAVLSSLAETLDGASSGVSLTGEKEGYSALTLRLMGLFPFKTIPVSVEEEKILIPGGSPVGVAIKTQGVVVVGVSDLGGSVKSPARTAGLTGGDLILEVDGTPVTGAHHLSTLIDSGDIVVLTVDRNGDTLYLPLQPVLDTRDNTYRLGAWVRDSTAGVGTLSFYDPESGRYGALGHAITDIDTGTILSIDEGLLFDSCVVDIQRGASGAPGELIGQFSLLEEAVGSICKNTEFGIFGSLDAPAAEGFTGAIPLAEPNEVKSGKAQLYTTLDGEGVRAYDCEITRVTAQNAPATRSMTIRITDKQLIEKTGGIAQGMSGSPIIQNGKLVGVVTHVYVGDPQQGYAVYAKWMYDEMAA